MKPSLFIFLGIFLTCFGLLNFYIGLRGWQAFHRWLPDGSGKIYGTTFALLALSYLLGRFSERIFPGHISNGLTLVGAYWLGAATYFLLILVLIDLLRLANHWLHFIPTGIMQSPAVTGLSVLILVSGLIVYGSWNARHPKVRHYDITIPKAAGSLHQLHIVMASDLHLGNIVDASRLSKMVDQVNALQPDIVMFPGDTIDEEVGPYFKQGMPDIFRRLHPKYGVFAIMGNHEYIGGQGEEAYHALQDTGMTVLRDDCRKIADNFYLIGRDDVSKTRYDGQGRKSLSAIMTGVNHALPVILLDHQPSHLKESQQEGVDLQLSGHTHNGQFFPNNLITRRVFEDDWGYLRKGNYQLIVSCGFGTWGPPIRIGNTPEIVDITVHFTAPAH